MSNLFFSLIPFPENMNNNNLNNRIINTMISDMLPLEILNHFIEKKGFLLIVRPAMTMFNTSAHGIDFNDVDGTMQWLRDTLSNRELS